MSSTLIYFILLSLIISTVQCKNAQNVTCLCGAPQTMAHLTSCSACPNTCTQDELMTASDGAVLVAQFWQGPEPYNMTKQSAKYDNPNFIRDRYKYKIFRPLMPEKFNERFKQPFSPAYMDYCDPYHCNDYHKIACGLNRANMKFRWFQSLCHIILNNKCASYRGALKYDIIETKFCVQYVVNSRLRAGCEQECDDVTAPVCGASNVDKHVVLFKNKCSLTAANCRAASYQEYEEVNMAVCKFIVPSS